MAGNHLNIGVGLGDATLWNSEPAIQNFTNILAQRKAERDAEKQQLVNQIGSIDATKLRAPDKEDYYNKMQDWQNTAIAAQNMPRNSREKMMAQGQALQKLNELKSFIAASAQAGAEHKQIGNQLLNDSFRHQFTDDAVNKYTQSNNLPMSNPNFISDPNTLERQVDHEKEDELSDKIKKQQLDAAVWSNPIVSQGVDKLGNRTGVIEHNEKKIDPTDVAHFYLMRYDASRNFAKSLDDRYRSLQGDTPSQTKAMRVQAYMNDRGENKGWADNTIPKFKENRVDNYYDHRLFAINNPMPGQLAANAATPLTTNYIEPARVGGMPEVNKWLGMAPTSQFRQGQKPTSSMVNGLQVINIPDQVQLDPKIVAANQKVKDNYAKNPQKDGFMGMMGNPVPFEKSDKFKKIADPYKVVKPGYQETLDPNDPVGYHAKAGEISTELKIPVTAINHQAGGKGGRGINPGITNQKPISADYQHTQQGKNSKGDLITIGYKNGRWYDIKTNKPVE